MDTPRGLCWGVDHGLRRCRRRTCESREPRTFALVLHAAQQSRLFSSLILTDIQSRSNLPGRLAHLTDLLQALSTPWLSMAYNGAPLRMRFRLAWGGQLVVRGRARLRGRARPRNLRGYERVRAAPNRDNAGRKAARTRATDALEAPLEPRGRVSATDGRPLLKIWLVLALRGG